MGTLPAILANWSDTNLLDATPGATNITFTGNANPLQSLQNLKGGDLISAIQSAAAYLQQLSGFSFLQQKLPIINRSISDLLNYAQSFQAISNGAAGVNSIQQVILAGSGICRSPPATSSATSSASIIC